MEVAPVNPGAGDFALGTIVNIVIFIEKKSDAKNIILPLSAIEIGQNDTKIFTVENGQAKTVPVTIVKIQGETAEIKTDLPDTAIVITDGNKLIQEGDPILLAQ